MKTFEESGLSAELLRGIAEMGFTEPTPVQAKVIPLLLKGGRDVVALAQTGTGKTAAYGLPLLQLTDPANSATQALVLCPTRELCVQITRDLADFGRFAPHLRVLAVYGGTSISQQMRALRQGVHIVVATPGRLNDLMRRGCAKLDQVSRVVLDEADEMLNMGFEEDLEAILKDVPETALTLLFSATMPRQVASIAAKYMQDPEEIVIGRRNEGAANVAHECYTVHARDRYAALKRIIDCRPGLYGIVFCRTRIETQEVASRLMADGYNSDALHGDMSQDQRDRVMNNFRRRHLQILVATDVAARGLDVDDLTHVINYDLPGDPEVYTHRSGRTGRAGKSGVSIVLVHMREDYKVRAIERIMNKRFEYKSVPSGREVCEAQLVAMIGKVKELDLAAGDLGPFLPRIEELLADLPREEIVQRFILAEFGRFLDFYRNAPDLNAHVKHGGRPGKPVRPDRPGYGERPHYAGGPGQDYRRERPAPMLREPLEGPTQLLRVNLGKMNGLSVPDLIGLINRATPGPMYRLGRIRVMEQDSVFEVPAGAGDVLIPNLSQAIYRERAVRCVAEHDPHHGAGRNKRPQHGGPGPRDVAPRDREDRAYDPRGREAGGREPGGFAPRDREPRAFDPRDRAPRPDAARDQEQRPFAGPQPPFRKKKPFHRGKGPRPFPGQPPRHDDFQ